MTFAYSILNIKATTVSGKVVVTEFSFKITCTHNNQTDFSIVPVYVVEGETFTPFEELTEEQMIGWALESLGPEVDALRKGLISLLETTTQQYQVTAPWVKN